MVANVGQPLLLDQVDATLARGKQTVTIWGLTAQQVHDAYWRSQGVQCVRRGIKQQLQRGADLYMLVDSEQLVLFDLGQVTERLTWHNAAVTRLRLAEEDPQQYSERVVIDQDGCVMRIERRYRPRVHGCWRVTLTTHRRIASLWMAAGRNRREAWDRVRRAVAWPRVDHWRVRGRVFRAGHLDDERRLLDLIVSRWPHPDTVIGGLEQLEPGVWKLASDPTPTDGVRVGPLWLGRGAAAKSERCVIGPCWVEDQPQSVSKPPAVPLLRDISEIEFGRVSRIVPVQATQGMYPFFKRCVDILASAAALTLLAPLMALIALVIVMETGRPVFFGHLRQGRGGRLFRCWKFRTMHRGADRAAVLLRDRNLCDGPQVFIKDDPRVTRVGRLLRAANLDELPQFWNVLIGQMSLVGPRPSPDDENQYCPAWRDLRLSVRPGITGLWQLKRTREPGEDFQEWIKYDIEYVHRASFWVDVVIIFKTAWILLLRRRNTSCG